MPHFHIDPPLEGAVLVTFINEHHVPCHYFTLEIPDILEFVRSHGRIILDYSNEDDPEIEFHVRLYDDYNE